MKKKNLRVILNGKAAGRDDVRQGIKTIRSSGHDVSVRVTWEAGDAPRLAREAVAEAREAAIDTLVAAGGDGTVNEVIAAVLDAVPDGDSPPFDFAVLPLGTANDFARGIGLDPSDVLTCLRAAVRLPARPTDIGLVNGRAFVNMATGGFGTRVTAETDPTLKRLLGAAAYLFTGLNRFNELAACEARFEADGFEWQGAFLALAIGNGRQAGGGVELCPEAELEDGLLDLTIIPYPRSDQVAELIGQLIEKGPESLRDSLIMRKLTDIRISSDQTIQFNLDGEPVHGQEWKIGIRPNRIDVIRPK